MANSGKDFLPDFRVLVEADAHSGATVADFNRVPVFLS